MGQDEKYPPSRAKYVKQAALPEEEAGLHFGRFDRYQTTLRASEEEKKQVEALIKSFPEIGKTVLREFPQYRVYMIPTHGDLTSHGHPRLFFSYLWLEEFRTLIMLDITTTRPGAGKLCGRLVDRIISTVLSNLPEFK